MLIDEEIKKIFSRFNKSSLSENIIEDLKERNFYEDTGCIELLLCKTAPIVEKIHERVFSKNSDHPPLFSSYIDHDSICRKKYSLCDLM